MASFSNELSQQTWESVLNTDDVNQAYDSFLHIFVDIFNKHCPVKKFPPKSFENKTTWFTKGLKRAYTKTNKLYKTLIVMRSAEAEQKYKTYKHLLSSIIYYYELQKKTIMARC